MTVKFDFRRKKSPKDIMGRWHYYQGAPDSDALNRWLQYDRPGQSENNNVYPLYLAYMVKDIEDVYNGALDRLAKTLGVSRTGPPVPLPSGMAVKTKGSIKMSEANVGITPSGNSPYALSALYGAIKNVLGEPPDGASRTEEEVEADNLLLFKMAVAVMADLMSAGLRIVDKEDSQDRLEV